MERILSNRTRFGQRIAFLLCTTVLFLVVVGFVNFILLYEGRATDVRFVRISVVIQDLFLFVVPAVITVCLISINPIEFLSLKKFPKLKHILLWALVVLVSMPAMNWLVEWNKSLSLPESMHAIEEWMINAENQATEMTKLFLNNSSIAGMIMSVLIVGVFTGFSEEIFFRGTLQRIFSTKPMNIHLSIWLAAFIFSAFHFQFFGFFPRLLLGAFFGYLLVWSGSLWLPIIAHIFNNSLVIISAQFADSASGKLLEQAGTSEANMGYLAVISVVLTAFIITAYLKFANKDSK